MPDTYIGLVAENPLRAETSGIVDLKLNRLGRFSGKLTLGRKRHGFRGSFTKSEDGESYVFSGPIRRHGASEFLLEMTMSGSGFLRPVSGTIVNSDVAEPVNSAFTLSRAVYDRTLRYPGAPASTFAITPVDGGSLPLGHGFGSIKINSAGKARLRGKLGDGSKLSTATHVVRKNDTDQIPLYVAPYREPSTGAIFGDIDRNEGQTFAIDLHAVLDWLKPGEFEGQADLIGSAFRRQSEGFPLFPIRTGADNLKLTALGDGIAETLVTTMDDRGRVEGNVARLKGDGSFSGKFSPTASEDTLRFEGNLLQALSMGYGQYKDGDMTGKIELISNDPPGGNDDFENRFHYLGDRLVAVGDNTAATFETDEPEHAAPGGKSLWWSWKAPANMAVTLSTEGSDFDTTLAVYRSRGDGDNPPSVSRLSPWSANDDASDTQTHSEVRFHALKGFVFQIAVDGKNGAAGNVVLRLDTDIIQR